MREASSKDAFWKFARVNATDPAMRREAGRAFSRVGVLHWLLGRHAQAEEATRKGIGLDRGEDDATITNRGHIPQNDLRPTTRKCNDVPRHLLTVSRDITMAHPEGFEPPTF